MIISKLGGVGEVARICGITAGAVSQWTMIPARHQAPLLNRAIERGLDITSEHFIPMPKPKKNGKGTRQ